MKSLGLVGRSSLAVAMILAAFPSGARADDTTNAGILGLLGLQAVDGKTTLNQGAGTTEATLLISESVNEASAIIAGLINASGAATDGRVLVITKAETVNLANLVVMQRRMRDLSDRAGHALHQSCGAPEVQSLASGAGGHSLTLADIAAAAMTTTAYSQVTVTVNDSLLVNSFLANARASLNLYPTGPGPVSWRIPDWGGQSGGPVRFILPSEAQGTNNGSLLTVYGELSNDAAQLRSCSEHSEAVKPLLAVIDAYMAGVNAVSADQPVSPLARALQLDAAMSSEQTAAILRLTVETSGGTTANRQSIWYTLGFPGAATVSAGVMISFRVIDSGTGAATLSGVIRCAARPRNIRSIENFVRSGNGICTYIAGPFSVRPAG